MTPNTSTHTLPNSARCRPGQCWRSTAAVAPTRRPLALPWARSTPPWAPTRRSRAPWWADEDPLTFDLERPDEWRWTLAVPAGPDTSAPGEASDVRLEQRAAERVARLVHRGPYEDETPSLSALRAFVADSGLVIAGAHTETYLNDPRTTAPADLRTELRVPVAEA